MATFLMLLASMFVSLSNLCMRRSLDAGGSAKGFLVFQMSMALFVAILLNPVRTGHYEFHLSVASLGVLAGLFLAGMFFSLGKALEKGPPGLTFSILNAATVIPAIFMAAIFGAAMGYPYT